MAISTETIKMLREATGAGVLDCKKALEATGGDFEQATAYLREKGLAAAAKKAERVAKEGMVKILVDGQGQVGVMVEVNCETDFVARTEDFQQLANLVLKQVADNPQVADLPSLLALPCADDSRMTLGERLTQVIAKVGENIVVRRFARVTRNDAGWVEGYLHPGNRIGVILHLSAAGNRELAGSAPFRELAHDLALQVAAAAPEYISSADIPAAVLQAEKAKYQAQIADEKKPDHIKERIITGKLDKWYEQVCLLQQPFIKDDTVRIGALIEQKGQQWNTPVSVAGFVRYELGSGE